MTLTHKILNETIIVKLYHHDCRWWDYYLRLQYDEVKLLTTTTHHWNYMDLHKNDHLGNKREMTVKLFFN